VDIYHCGAKFCFAFFFSFVNWAIVCFVNDD
jgi:hypothetical protein